MHRLAVISTVAAATVLGVACTAPGRWIDRSVASHRWYGWMADAGDAVVAAVNGWTVAAVALGLALLTRGAPLSARLLPVTSGGVAALVARAIKRALEDLEILTDAERPLGGGFFPSGHATVTLAVALAATLTVPALRGHRKQFVLVAVLSLHGTCTVLLESHHTSDVLAGYLIGTAVTATLTLVAGVWITVSPSPSTTPPGSREIGAVIVAAVLSPPLLTVSPTLATTTAVALVTWVTVRVLLGAGSLVRPADGARYEATT